MVLKLLLPWFPVVLAVGLGGRLLGKGRGYALGAICALFWLALVQASYGGGVWHAPWTAVTLLAGGLGIVCIGGWSGSSFQGVLSAPHHSAEFSKSGHGALDSRSAEAPLKEIAACIDQFDDWLEHHRQEIDPWPKFDEFIRTILFQTCRATHVLPLRLVPDSDQLVPLREAGISTDSSCRSATEGVVGEVMSSGRAFALGMSSESTAVAAEHGQENIAWCFPIIIGSARLGAVVVRRLGVSPSRHRELLHAVECLVTQFWHLLSETCYSRSAVQDDTVSGLHAREAFLRIACEALDDSFQAGEPAAMVVVGLEGMRELNDSGRWEVADELVRAVGGALRQKLRSDDLAGRFDGSRFLLLLRRVDAELGTLIVAQLLQRLQSICIDSARWGSSVRVRCGFVTAGDTEPEIRKLISAAMAQWRRAREENATLAYDTAAGSGTYNSEESKDDCQLAEVAS